MIIRGEPEILGEYNTAEMLGRVREALVKALPEFEDIGSGAYVSTEKVDCFDIQFKRR